MGESKQVFTERFVFVYLNESLFLAVREFFGQAWLQNEKRLFADFHSYWFDGFD